MRPLTIPVILAVFLSPAFAMGQGLSEVDAGEESGSAPRTRVVLPAVRVQGPEPVVDGFLLDQAWRVAPIADGFVQLEPAEGELATEPTEVRVLYGADALFVAFRAWDSQPDSIAAQLTRRDNHSYSDAVHLIVDSYFDRRTAFHFGVNPVGVKVDMYRYDDTQEDATWDAVWDVATQVDADGWTAEFRIPYSQLRFGQHEDQTWGINFAREIARKNETSTWAPIRQSDAAVVSRSGELQGLRGLGSPMRMELRPFSLARLGRAPGTEENPFYEQNDFKSSLGLDLKYGVTNDLTLDVTVNPDFGQVEADPAQVNLTAFETFFPEQRPFFIEGANIYNFAIGVGGGELGSESLFYSRRIGRPPQGRPDVQGGYSDQPDRTTILGAWKLSGKTRSGWSIGLLHSLTQEETASVQTGTGSDFREAIEPWSNYGVARVQKDFREGRTALGFIGTATNRSREVANDLGLRNGAYTGGFDFRHRFGANDRFHLSAFLLGSHVRGSEIAMASTQRSPSRYYQRPDATHTDYDPTRTSLSGWAAKAEFAKRGGDSWHWGSLVSAKSPGFEANDLGYQREADLILHVLYAGYNHYQPTDHLRRWNLNSNFWHGWTFGGERIARGFNVNGGLTLPSYWGASVGLDHDFESFSDGTLRGGPLVRGEARNGGWFALFSDERKAVQLNLRYNWGQASESDSESSTTSLNLRWRPSGRASIRLGPFYSQSANDLQWIQKVQTDQDHFVFGRIDQETVGFTGRLDFTFTPNLSLQLYAQPFVSAGSYSDFKEVVEPRAGDYEGRIRRFSPSLEDGRYVFDFDGDTSTEGFRYPDFNIKQFRSTAVLRWEYRPGSLLYLVWSQGRDHWVPDGRLRFGDDLDTLFGAEAENVFMVKASYWITP